MNIFFSKDHLQDEPLRDFAERVAASHCDNINIEAMDYDDLKQRKGTIDNYYDQYGNWWLVFVFTEETDDDIHTVFNVLDFKPAKEL